MVVLGSVGIASAGLALLAVRYVDDLPPERPTTTASLPRREVEPAAPAGRSVEVMRPGADQPKSPPEVAKAATTAPVPVTERPATREAYVPLEPRAVDPATAPVIAAPKIADTPKAVADTPARPLVPTKPLVIASRLPEPRPFEIVLTPPPPVPAASVVLQGESAPLPTIPSAPPPMRTARTEVAKPPVASDVVVPLPPAAPAIVTAEIATRSPPFEAAPEIRPITEARPMAEARPAVESKPIIEARPAIQPMPVHPDPVVAVRTTGGTKPASVRPARTVARVAAKLKERPTAKANKPETRVARRKPARDPETTGSTRPIKPPVRAASPAPRPEAAPKPFSLPDALRPGSF